MQQFDRTAGIYGTVTVTVPYENRFVLYHCCVEIL